MEKINPELTEFRSAYFDVVIEEHDPCKVKETVLPEGSRWVKHEPRQPKKAIKR